MQHRELYRSLVPEGAYIITFSDLLSCPTRAAAAKIARGIYYPLGGSYSSDQMKEGTDAHAIKEAEDGDWQSEVRLAYHMDRDYWLTGTMDRYYNSEKLIEDFKTTTSPAMSYLKTKQVETYAFLAINNDMTVEGGRYTTIDAQGKALDTIGVDINSATVVTCYATFILPRFNMIKREIEGLRNQYV